MSENAKNNRLKKEERRGQILKAALDVFQEKGFNGSTTKEIAEKAGVAEGTVFRYFKTKKDLLLAMIPEEVADSLGDLFKNMKGSSEEDILKAVLKNRLGLVKKNFPVARMLFSEAQYHPEIRESFIEKIILKSVRHIEVFLEDKTKQGKFKDYDPRILSRAFAGMIFIFILWKEVLQADNYVNFNEDEVIDKVVDIYLNGVRRKQ